MVDLAQGRQIHQMSKAVNVIYIKKFLSLENNLRCSNGMHIIISQEEVKFLGSLANEINADFPKWS